MCVQLVPDAQAEVVRQANRPFPQKNCIPLCWTLVGGVSRGRPYFSVHCRYDGSRERELSWLSKLDVWAAPPLGVSLKS